MNNTEQSVPAYKNCTACPRACSVNRTTARGFCRESAAVKVAWAGLHFGEEPPITGCGGSGTVFVTGCNLRCAFCQNYQISQNGMGSEINSNVFIEICLKLQKLGAENINIVTGSHAIPALAVYLRDAKNAGLCVPVCWNCSAYETPEALALLDGLADIWLPDLKTLNPLMSEELFAARDYPAAAKKAIRFMIERAPLRMAETTGAGGEKKQKMLSGVIIRHLILPGRLDDTRAVLDWFAAHAADKALLSLMTQYTPVRFTPEEAQKRREPLSAFANRYINETEFKAVHAMLEEYGIEDGFYQELVQDSSWLPDFNLIQPFSSELAKPVWHWKTGMVT